MKSSTCPGRLFFRSSFLPGGLLFVFISLSASCATFGSPKDTKEKLVKSIELYNLHFEAKTPIPSAVLVLPDKREQFLLQAEAIKARLSFYETSLVFLNLLKDGQPIKMVGGEPEEEFNEAMVTLRYRLAVLPSTQVKTLVVKQRWVLQEGNWFVDPDLDVYLQ